MGAERSLPPGWLPFLLAVAFKDLASQDSLHAAGVQTGAPMTRLLAIEVFMSSSVAAQETAGDLGPPQCLSPKALPFTCPLCQGPSAAQGPKGGNAARRVSIQCGR